METRKETEEEFVEVECCIPACLYLPKSLYDTIAADIGHGLFTVEDHLLDYLSNCESLVESFADTVVEWLREDYEEEQQGEDE